MRKLTLMALIGAVALPSAMPAAAFAQSHGDVRRDVRQLHDERRDVRDARRDVRDEKRDVRDARRDLRRDAVDERNHRWAENDWRDYRGRNRTVFVGPRFSAPFRYNAFRPGVRIAPAYYSNRRYVILDPWRYHLPPTPAGYYRYVRHYNDVLLVDTRRGTVIRVYRSFYL